LVNSPWKYFLEGAHTKAGLLSAKRWLTVLIHSSSPSRLKFWGLAVAVSILDHDLYPTPVLDWRTGLKSYSCITLSTAAKCYEDCCLSKYTRLGPCKFAPWWSV
jgi:hypothetical protein